MNLKCKGSYCKVWFYNLTIIPFKNQQISYQLTFALSIAKRLKYQGHGYTSFMSVTAGEILIGTFYLW